MLTKISTSSEGHLSLPRKYRVRGARLNACDKLGFSSSQDVTTRSQEGMALESLRYVNGQFEVLDQLLLPHESKYVAVTNCKDGWNVIKNMQVPTCLSRTRLS